MNLIFVIVFHQFFSSSIEKERFFGWGAKTERLFVEKSFNFCSPTEKSFPRLWRRTYPPCSPTPSASRSRCFRRIAFWPPYKFRATPLQRGVARAPLTIIGYGSACRFDKRNRLNNSTVVFFVFAIVIRTQKSASIVML